MTNLKGDLLRAFLLTAAGTLAMSAAIAQAQTTQPQETAAATAGAEEIIVTGTRIARPDLETSSPVNVVGAEEISLRQSSTAEDLLRDLPSVRPSLGPAVNNGSDGSSSVNLRGLGDNRTLVLLDGRRLVPFGLDGITDLNTIPVALVERVDVVTGGASSVYGADAVAGVVNFVLKRDFSGVDLSTNYRISGRGDAQSFRADLLIGANTDDGRGNVVLGLGYQKREALEVTERPIAAFPISSTTGLFTGSTASVPTILTAPGNAALGIGTSSVGAAFDPATGLLRPATAADTYNTNLSTYFQTPFERYNAFAQAKYEFTPALEIYGSAMFTRNLVTLQLAPSATFTNTYRLPLSNPYLPVGVRNQLCNSIGFTAAQCTAAAGAQGATDPNYREIPVIAQRRFVEYGPRSNPIESTQFQVQVGARGAITETLRYDLSAQYGETNQNQTRGNWGSFSRVQQALRAYRTPTGQLVCNDPSNGCVPLNLFGPAGSITRDQINFFALDAFIRRKVQQTVVTGGVSGDLFGLTSPFASSAAAFSVGAEYRRLQARSSPDAPSQIQGEVLGTGARTPPDFGEISVKEVFGELIVPLIEDKPFFNNLTLEAGIRYSDYNTTGASTTWKAGGSWEPVDGFKFRGMYQRAVRSPNIQELFQSPVQGLGNLTVDPCQANQLPNAAANPGLAALCIATGAPASQIGFISAPSSTQINVTTQGNRNLDVERASTITLGAVLTPAFAPGLAVTVDFFDIKVRNAITQPAQGDILNGCYSAALNPSYTFNAFCQLIGRNPLNGSLNGAGETPGVILGYSNLGVIKTRGIDAGVSYRFDLADDSALRLSANGTWLDYYQFQANPNSINRDCTGVYSTNCTNPRPEWKVNSRLTYTRGIFDVSLLWNYISSVKLEPFNATAIRPLTTPQAGGPNPATVLDAFERIGAYSYFDLAIRANPTERLEFTLTVENLFDKDPPLVGSGVGGTAFNNGNTFPTTYDAIGRTFSVGARIKF